MLLYNILIMMILMLMILMLMILMLMIPGLSALVVIVHFVVVIVGAVVVEGVHAHVHVRAAVVAVVDFNCD